jgi:site-specific recombinase XerD
VAEWKSKRLGASSQPRASRPNSGTSIYTALQEFIRYLRDERQASEFTLDAYERDLLRFAGVLEAAGKDLDVTAVTPEDVRAHMRSMIDRHLAKATVRRALYALGSFFGWAVRWGLVPMSPVARVTVPRRERVREVRALSRRERAVLIATADRLAKGSRRPLDAHAPTMLRLMLKTGLRRGEVLELRWRDVDLDAGELFVRYGKGRKSRRLPIEDADLLARLSRGREQRGVDAPGNEAALDEPVFASTRRRPIARSSFYRLFHRVLAAAELSGRGIRPHSLRHTFGSMLCARGVPVPYVKDLLGHEDIGSTMIYVHSTPAALREAVRKLRD